MNILVVLCAALINRLRGGGLVAPYLPGHARLWAAPAMGLLSALAGAGWLEAVAWGLGYFVWSTLPINRFDVLGRTVQTKQPTLLEDALENLAWNMHLPYYHGPMFIRECLGILPCLTAVSILAGPWWLWSLAPLYALAAVAVTEAAHHLRPGKFRPVAEPLVGAIWGLLFLV